MSKKVITKKSEQFLENYLNNASPTGFESGGQKMWMEYIKPYVDEFKTDTYGTAVAIINPKAAYKVVIEAHADEISWFVHYITNDGFVYVRRNGAVKTREYSHQKGNCQSSFWVAGDPYKSRKRGNPFHEEHLFGSGLYIQRRSRKIRCSRGMCDHLRRHVHGFKRHPICGPRT
jgi:hypothetical protein